MSDDRYFRGKVTWMMFILSIFVIWIHAVNLPLFCEGGELFAGAFLLEDILAVQLGQVSVPGFFMLSSYLFFRTYSFSKTWEKWRSRFKSVVIPYVVWNSLYYLGYAAATRVDALSGIVGRREVPLGIGYWLDAVLHYEYAPVLWFLFQLILLLLLSPVIYSLIANRFVGLIYLGVLIWLVYEGKMGAYPNTDALLYYSAAGWMALHGKRIVEEYHTGRNTILGFGFLAFSLLCFQEMRVYGTHNLLWTVGYRMAVPLAFWFLVPSSILPEPRMWMRQSMFIYAVHFPLVRLINKGGALALRSVCMEPEILCVTAVLFFLLIPLGIVAFSYGAARLLSRRLPFLWKLLAGGRELK